MNLQHKCPPSASGPASAWRSCLGRERVSEEASRCHLLRFQSGVDQASGGGLAVHFSLRPVASGLALAPGLTQLEGLRHKPQGMRGVGKWLGPLQTPQMSQEEEQTCNPDSFPADLQPQPSNFALRRHLAPAGRCHRGDFCWSSSWLHSLSRRPLGLPVAAGLREPSRRIPRSAGVKARDCPAPPRRGPDVAAFPISRRPRRPGDPHRFLGPLLQEQEQQRRTFLRGELRGGGAARPPPPALGLRLVLCPRRRSTARSLASQEGCTLSALPAAASSRLARPESRAWPSAGAAARAWRVPEMRGTSQDVARLSPSAPARNAARLQAASVYLPNVGARGMRRRWAGIMRRQIPVTGARGVLFFVFAKLSAI